MICGTEKTLCCSKLSSFYLAKLPDIPPVRKITLSQNFIHRVPYLNVYSVHKNPCVLFLKFCYLPPSLPLSIKAPDHPPRLPFRDETHHFFSHSFSPLLSTSREHSELHAFVEGRSFPVKGTWWFHSGRSPSHMAAPHFSIFCRSPLLCHRHCSVLRELCLLSFQWGLVDLTQQTPPYSQEEITVACEDPSNTHLITSDDKSRFLCREA